MEVIREVMHGAVSTGKVNGEKIKRRGMNNRIESIDTRQTPTTHFQLLFHGLE
jgi:hypothetical protein